MSCQLSTEELSKTKLTDVEATQETGSPKIIFSTIQPQATSSDTAIFPNPTITAGSTGGGIVQVHLSSTFRTAPTITSSIVRTLGLASSNNGLGSLRPTADPTLSSLVGTSVLTAVTSIAATALPDHSSNGIVSLGTGKASNDQSSSHPMSVGSKALIASASLGTSGC